MTTQTTTQTSQNADSQYTEDMDIVVVSPELNRDSMSDTEYARQCQQLDANSLHDALLRAMSGATTWRTP